MFLKILGIFSMKSVFLQKNRNITSCLPDYYIFLKIKFNTFFSQVGKLFFLHFRHLSQQIFNHFFMEVITIESQVFKELVAKINTIFKFVTTKCSKAEEKPEDGWVDSYEVCTFLKISTKTLQRLRAADEISYSKIRGKNYYRISEIQRLLNDNIIRRSDEHLQELIRNSQLSVEQRRNLSSK